MKLLDVVNPATDELITQLRIDDGAAVAIKAQKARNAQAAWAAKPLADRIVCIPVSYTHLTLPTKRIV